MKLELKHINPYACYCLKGLFQGQIDILHSIEYENNIVSGLNTGNVLLNDFKPILRPLSDIEDNEDNTTEEIQRCCYSYVEGLFKEHFDVFGLIDKGLAINKNTL